MTELMCRSADDPSKPCQYAGAPCHGARQEVVAAYGIRGWQCAWYVKLETGAWPEEKPTV